MSLSPFDAYRLYTAIKLHMTTDKYDFVRYCGKVRSITPAGFDRRNDKWSFVKLAKMFSREEDLILFVACNHLHGSPYIRDLTHLEEYKENYIRHARIRESLEYTVLTDLRYLLDTFEKPMDMLAVHHGEWPALAKCVSHKKVNIETVCVLGGIMGFFPMWNTKVTDTILWPIFYRQLTKFSAFVSFDAATLSQKISAMVAQHKLEKELTIPA